MNHSAEINSDLVSPKRVKMATKAIQKHLTTEEILEKFAGPKVDIYVGPDSKHFHLPKDIICYYSSYFDRCFNSGFKEAKEQKLILLEDRPEHFQHLLDYMFLNGGGSFEFDGDVNQKMTYYMEFIDYCGKYDLLGASQIIQQSIKEIFKNSFESSSYYLLESDHIETIFRVLPEGHELRAWVSKPAVRYGFNNTRYETQETLVDGFAAEVLKQVRVLSASGNPSYLVKFRNGIDNPF